MTVHAIDMTYEVLKQIAYSPFQMNDTRLVRLPVVPC